MTNLRVLHQSMKALNTDIQQFQVNAGSASFDCLFSTREVPFVLALTSRGAKPTFFKFEVKQGYWITPFFDGFFYDLAEVLKSRANTGNRLNPKTFLAQLNAKIPQRANTKNIPTSKQIIVLRPDITDNRDKPYFDTWIYWTSELRQGPTTENRKKTRLLLGTEAHAYSVEMRASSKWSAIDLNKNWT